MVANYPSRMPSHEADTESRADDHAGTAVVARVRRIFCGMHGHDNLLQFERDRMFLRCVSCGHESPGWALTETPPTVTEPLVRRSSPAMQCKSVDLPDPEGPKMAVNWLTAKSK